MADRKQDESETVTTVDGRKVHKDLLGMDTRLLRSETMRDAVGRLA